MIVNLFAGPGAGKSTLALGIAYELKKRGWEAAVIVEEAKPYALQGREIGPFEQLQIAAEQARNEAKYHSGADYVVTDSPLELQAFYHWLRTGEDAYGLIVRGLRGVSPLIVRNFFLSRTLEYRDEGRYQNEEEAKKVDQKLRTYLNAYVALEAYVETNDPVEFVEQYL